MKTKVFLIIVISFLGIAVVSGQKSNKKIIITGTVVDGTRTGIANAIVLVDGEKSGYMTDSKGFYKVRVRPGNLKIGILTNSNGLKEEIINGRNRIDFQFEGSVPDQKVSEANQGEDVVNVGYGVSKKKNLTGAVSEIDGRNSKYASYHTIYDMIKGEVPGVEVRGTSVYIRNPSTLIGSTEPLFVVDDVPVTSIGDIQPIMVRSISVLKGPDASIYGVRGSNGVIIITLKKGADK